MKINGTLFVQAINFGIGYLLLRYFLFKPVVSLILQKDRDRETVQKNIDLLHEQIALSKQEQELLWKELAVDIEEKRRSIKKDGEIPIEDFDTKLIPNVEIIEPSKNQTVYIDRLQSALLTIQPSPSKKVS